LWGSMYPAGESIGAEVGGKVMPRIAATPQAHCQTMYARKGDRYRRAIERNFDPVSQLEAMDTLYGIASRPS
jgi:hypothetical protein